MSSLPVVWTRTMCGRFVVASPPLLLAEHFAVDEVRLDVDADPAATANYNVAPTDRVAAVACDRRGRRLLGAFQWGLVPSWAADPSGGARLINARAETLAEKPAFREAFTRRRCLIPADGFYEWRLTTGGLKQPVFVSPAPSEPALFAFAGLWDVWRGASDAPPLRTCTIVTTVANSRLSSLHHRMPVVLPPSAWATWLDPAVDDRVELSALLAPAPDDAIALRDVSRAVNDVRNNGPELLDVPA